MCGSRKIRKGVVQTTYFSVFAFSHQGRTDLSREAGVQLILEEYVPVFLKKPGLEVIKLEFILKLRIKRNDWLLAYTCPQAANHIALF